MANGQQKAEQNVAAFMIWTATLSDDDYTKLIYRGLLSRVEIAKAIGCGRSALNQNPQLRKLIASLEDNLRAKGILPLLNSKAEKVPSKPKEYDHNYNSREADLKRFLSLEQENIELKAKIEELKSKLARLSELSEIIIETGFVPR